MSFTTPHDNTLIVTIQWNSPTDTGNGLPIQNYTITVTLSEIDYSETVTVDCSDSSCSHTFLVDGSGDNVMYNTEYEIAVNITAINTCGMESSPATGTGTLEFVAHGQYYTQSLILTAYLLTLYIIIHPYTCAYDKMH